VIASKPAVIEAAQFTNALDDAQGPVEGCFVEWQERSNTPDAEMIVRLTVNPDGLGHSASASGPDSPSLRFCVTAALTNQSLVKYPTGRDQLEVEVRIQWSAGLLTMQPRVVGRRTVSDDAPDLR
jgi:hypothetical protein